MAFVERIAFEVEGEGEPVLMIHGLGGTSNTWTGLLPSLARHKKIRFDLPGSGRSHRVEGPLSTQRFLEKALLVMGRAGAERVHVVAHSMGTIVAAHLAAAEPGKVLSLALFGPLLAPPEPARAAIRARAAQARDLEARMRTPPAGAQVALFAVPSDPAAVGTARQELRAALSGWDVDRDMTETAALCMSELVTNAVVHAGSGCHVQVTWGAGALTVEVRNPGSPPDLPEPDQRDPWQVHGRGLQLVDALTSRWGSDRDVDGFSAWFVLER